MMQDSVQEHRVSVIVGLGDTGFSCARHFIRRGRTFRVVDSRPEPPRLGALRELMPDAEIELGEFRAEGLLDAAELVVSPGVDLRNPALAAALEAGVPASGDIDIFSREAPGAIVAVTGSNGKSTVVAMLAAILDEAGVDYGLGGNLDGSRFRPVLELLGERARDWYVLEVSSFQLETVERLNAKVALLLNLSADHLDRYDSMEEYARAKQRIFRGSGSIVLNRDEAWSRPPAQHEGDDVPVLSYGLDEPAPGQFGLRRHRGESWLALGEQRWLPASELKLPGQHNVSNALAAMALALAMGMPQQAIVAGLLAFRGLPHRCQWLANIAGVDYYNDSKATNVGACMAAVRNLAAERTGRAGKVVLIAGGSGKGADFAPLAPLLRESARAAVLVGRDAAELAAVLAPGTRVHLAGSMADAVSRARACAEPGDAVLLSPACASFDMFEGFAQRGEAFARCVESLQ